MIRAKIVLLAAEGWDNIDRSRTGRPPVFPPSTAAAVKALACELPTTSNAPCHAGAALSWPAKPPTEAWSPQSPRPACSGG